MSKNTLSQISPLQPYLHTNYKEAKSNSSIENMITTLKIIRWHPQYLSKISTCVYDRMYQERQAFYDDRMASTELTHQLRYKETSDKQNAKMI